GARWLPQPRATFATSSRPDPSEPGCTTRTYPRCRASSVSTLICSRADIAATTRPTRYLSALRASYDATWPCYGLRARLQRLGFADISLRRAGALPPDHNSCSASSRNSSGTACLEPNTTDPYPIADQPKRSRMVSTARSAAQCIALSALLSKRRRDLSSPSSGRASCTCDSFARCDTRIPSSEILGSCRYSARTARTSPSAICASAADVGTGV